MTTKIALGSLVIKQSGYWASVDQINVDHAADNVARTQIAAVKAIWNGFDATCVAANQSGDFSPHRRAAALLQVSKRALHRMAATTGPNRSAPDGQITGHACSLHRAASGPDATTACASRAPAACLPTENALTAAEVNWACEA